jgi:hypothetical protein
MFGLLTEMLPLLLVVITGVAGYDAYRQATTLTNERNAPQTRARAKRHFGERGPLALAALLGLMGAGVFAFVPLAVPVYIAGRQVKRRYEATGDLL